MKVIESIEAFRKERRALEGTVAFVPTMGYLHEGHLALMREGKRRCDHLVVSIFVNPTQFGPGEDLERYPRDPEGDRQKCEAVGCDLLLMPPVEAVYAPEHATTVSVQGLTDVMCGPRRPGHFEGVATIVAKLFNIVQPHVAVFGEKDYQQLAVIRRMTIDLSFPIEIVGGRLVREDDGLAMSSRNRYLSISQRVKARALSEALTLAWQAYQAGERDPRQLVTLAERHLASAGELRIDYVECVHPLTLRPFDGEGARIPDEDGAVLGLAAFLGQTRLIDNLRLDHPLPVELRK